MTPAGTTTSGKPSLRTAVLPKLDLKLDGVLSGEAWAGANSIANLVAVEPVEGGVPQGKTFVKVLATPTEIAIGLLCQDPDPAGIVSFSKARDAELDDEDHVLITAPGRMQRLKESAVNRLPCHWQYLQQETLYTAELLAPIAFCAAKPIEHAVQGTVPPPNTIVHARLVTPLESGKTPRGTPVRAVVTEPLFRPDGRLILPEGAEMEGEVTFERGARYFHRTGRLRFLFENVRTSVQESQTLLAALYAAGLSGNDRIVLDDEGGAEVANLKSRFIALALALFRRDDAPVSLGIIIDNSGSMRSKRARVEAAALAFVRASNPQDEVFVLNFADKPQADVPFTSDVKMLESGISRVDSIGWTALRDAVDAAEQYCVEHAARDRKALLIVTDGNDNASVAKEARIRKQAERGQIAVHAIGLLNDDKFGKRARRELDDLADITGGLTYYPESLDEIQRVALDLARQIRNQCLIAYHPLNEARDGSYRSIRVAAKGPGPLSVRTRAGYRAN
ncbi:MAG: VWA domain-containing protein [Acidobacteria bacterium]|nr:VWA domain-containing protein [Acidobacteriota bacterium]